MQEAEETPRKVPFDQVGVIRLADEINQKYHLTDTASGWESLKEVVRRYMLLLKPAGEPVDEKRILDLWYGREPMPAGVRPQPRAASFSRVDTKPQPAQASKEIPQDCQERDSGILKRLGIVLVVLFLAVVLLSAGLAIGPTLESGEGRDWFDGGEPTPSLAGPKPTPSPAGPNW